MRKIGTIEKAGLAVVFSDYLYSKGMANAIEPASGDVREIWIHDEDAVERGREALARFLADPTAPEFVTAGTVAAERRRQERRQETAFSRTIHGRNTNLYRGFPRGMTMVRLLIILSLVATIFGGLGSGSRLTQVLSITEYTVDQGRLLFDPSLPEIARGQFWRLITPVFMHAALAAGYGYGILHLLFNVLWLRDLGGMLEKAQGPLGLLAKVLLIGVVSNLFQFASGGPAFGGMSGVVYGLLGYIWLRGRLDLTSGLYVSSQTMLMMIFWFFLCLTGEMGKIANAAHAGGLLSGLLWGWLAARRVNAPR